MTDDVFKLEEYGNFLFISVNGKRVTGKFDSSHRTDLNWIVCVFNGYVNEIVYWEKENQQLRKELLEFKEWEKHIGDVQREDIDRVFKMSIFEIAEGFEYYKKRIKELEELLND